MVVNRPCPGVIGPSVKEWMVVIRRHIVIVGPAAIVIRPVGISVRPSAEYVGTLHVDAVAARIITAFSEAVSTAISHDPAIVMRGHKTPVAAHALVDIHVMSVNVAHPTVLVPGYATVAYLCLSAECGVATGVKFRAGGVCACGMNRIAGVLPRTDG